MYDIRLILAATLAGLASIPFTSGAALHQERKRDSANVFIGDGVGCARFDETSVCDTKHQHDGVPNFVTKHRERSLDVTVGFPERGPYPGKNQLYRDTLSWPEGIGAVWLYNFAVTAGFPAKTCISTPSPSGDGNHIIIKFNGREQCILKPYTPASGNWPPNPYGPPGGAPPSQSKSLSSSTLPSQDSLDLGSDEDLVYDQDLNDENTVST